MNRRKSNAAARGTCLAVCWCRWPASQWIIVDDGIATGTKLRAALKAP